MPKPGPEKRPSVCIVTSELVGPFKNGGIGTSMTGIAQCLAKAGFPVTILYSGAHLLSGREQQHWLARFADIGIVLDWLDMAAPPELAGPVADLGFGKPFRVWQHLRDLDFDIIQFNDCLGDGYICLAMAKLGFAFQKSHLLVALHSPSQWVYEINRSVPFSPLTSAFNYAERLSVKSADLLWSPSHYLLDWAIDAGFELSEAHFVQQYAIPCRSFAVPVDVTERVAYVPDELVFFGRLEERKGLRLFCAALGKLNGLLQSRGVKVTFMGKVSSVAGQSATEFLNGQSSTWRFAWQIKGDLGQPEAIAHLYTGRTLAVMASPADNSPCTVYEALEEGLCFLAARTGGIPELIYPEDRDTVLFDYDLDALCDKIGRALENGIAPARPQYSQVECRERWVGSFAALSGLCPPRPQVREAERNWVVLIDHCDGDDLARSIASLGQLAIIERIIVLNHSGIAVDKSGLAARSHVVDIGSEGCRLLPERLNLSGTEAIFMMRSGSCIKPEGARVAAEALRTATVDGLLPAGLSRDGKLLLPVGGSPSFAYRYGVDLGGGVLVKGDRLLPLLDPANLAPEVEYCNMADLAVARGLVLWPLAEVVLVQSDIRILLDDTPAVPERLLAYSNISSVERYYVSAQTARLENAQISAIRVRYNRLLFSRGGWLVRRLREMLPNRLIRLLTRQWN